MTFVAFALSDDEFFLDCSVVILQKEIYIVVFFWGVTIAVLSGHATLTQWVLEFSVFIM